MRVAMIGLLAWSAIAAQDPPSADRLVEQLGDDDPSRRDEAERQLKLVGDDALPALRKALASSEAELSHRCRDLIQYLERTRRSRAILATGTPFSIAVPPEKPVPLPEVLAKLSRHFGVPVEVPDELKSLTWSGRIDRVKLLPALDRLSRDAGVAYAVGPGSILMAPGKFADRPCDYPGSFKVMARNAGSSFSTSFEQPPQRSVHFTLEALHQTARIWVRPAAIRVESVEFDTGERVKIDTENPKDRDKFRHDYNESGRGVRIPDPPANATTIRTIRGTLVLETPADYDVWVFDTLKPGAKVTDPRGTATLKEIDRGKYEGIDCATAFITLNGPLFGTAMMKRPGEIGRVELLSRDGTEAPIPAGWAPSHLWSAHWQALEVEARFQIPAESGFEPARIAVKIAKDYETVELPFVLRDLAIR